MAENEMKPRRARRSSEVSRRLDYIRKRNARQLHEQHLRDKAVEAAIESYVESVALQDEARRQQAVAVLEM